MRSFFAAPSIRDIPGADGFAVAFIVAVIGIACTAGASAWQARHPRPASYPRTVAEPAIIPDPPKTLTEPLRSIPVPTEKYSRLDPPVAKTKLRSTAGLPWTCDQVRHATQGLTQQQIERLARAHRLNDEQRAEARRCLKEKRT